jgi:hypothetical protein
MSKRRFFSQLFFLMLLTGLVLVFIHILQPFAPYKMLSMASLVFFAVFTVSIYFTAANAALSKDRNAFTRLIMLSTFVKMVLTGALIIGYHHFFKPADNYFLIPFFLIYIVFTTFETIFMSKLGKVEAR